MEIAIKKIGTQVSTGYISILTNSYKVMQDGKEYLLIRTSHAHGRSVSIAGKEGILYVDSDDNRVHRQIVTPGGACALVIDDEVVEGLSPLALRGNTVHLT